MTTTVPAAYAVNSAAPTTKQAWLESHEEGYHKGLKSRQVQMIAIGTGDDGEELP